MAIRGHGSCVSQAPGPRSLTARGHRVLRAADPTTCRWLQSGADEPTGMSACQKRSRRNTNSYDRMLD
jgi:hypothetical protein